MGLDGRYRSATAAAVDQFDHGDFQFQGEFLAYGVLSPLLPSAWLSRLRSRWRSSKFAASVPSVDR